MSVGTDLKQEAIASVTDAAREGREELVATAHEKVEGAIEHYRNRLALVIKSYPVAALAIFVVGYGVGSGAKWVGALL